jgi:transposase
MENEVILGVDVSKSWLDVHLLVNGVDANNAIRIKNSPAGFSKLVKWIESLTVIRRDHWLVCMEQTGLYSYRFNMFLQQYAIGQSMVSALAIKKSMGIIRGKTDKADAKLIAHYARRFKDTLRLFQCRQLVFRNLKFSSRKEIEWSK